MMMPLLTHLRVDLEARSASRSASISSSDAPLRVKSANRAAERLVNVEARDAWRRGCRSSPPLVPTRAT